MAVGEEREVMSRPRSYLMIMMMMVMMTMMTIMMRMIRRRGVYFSKNQYFFTNHKHGPARDSRDTLSLDSNISARTYKKCVFYAQLNKKLAKSTLYHIIHCDLMQPGLIWSNPNSDYFIVCRAPHDCVTRNCS